MTPSPTTRRRDLRRARVVTLLASGKAYSGLVSELPPDERRAKALGCCPLSEPFLEPRQPLGDDTYLSFQVCALGLHACLLLHRSSTEQQVHLGTSLPGARVAELFLDLQVGAHPGAGACRGAKL